MLHAKIEYFLNLVAFSTPVANTNGIVPSQSWDRFYGMFQSAVSSSIEARFVRIRIFLRD